MLYIKKLPAIILIVMSCSNAKAQVFTHADTLRGSNGPGREWWNATQYNLHVRFNIEDSSISGYNRISFVPIKNGKLIQIDLQEPMIIDSIVFNASTPGVYQKKYYPADIVKDGNAYFIETNFTDAVNNTLTVYYHGKPRVAARPPWDGGIIFKKDSGGSPWVSVACQGLGASVWYPCKDYQADEPDSAEMHFTIPDTLVAVSNGRLRNKTINSDGTATYTWAVVNPINNYNIIPYIGKYVHFGETYKGEKGKLTMDYWVLDSSLAKAKAHFTAVAKMMKAFEYWFGPYPFYADGFKLVESPHLGMEHQSAVAYGNGYQNGYLGRDISGSGWGLKWDYIIVHEAGHEWFGNNITTKDIADMWVQEGFTCYSETLYTEYYYGKPAGTAYVTGQRKRIGNKQPLIGTYGVNKEGSGDMYNKGANLLHTIRYIINNDKKFRKILRGLGSTFYHQTVTTGDVENYISTQSSINFSKIFDQYLRQAEVPVLEYRQQGDTLQYRFTNCLNGFTMPVKTNLKSKQWIRPTANWQTLLLKNEAGTAFAPDPNFYIITKKLD